MNKNFSPTVSVIIPLYNAEKYLPATLESLLAQFGGRFICGSVASSSWRTFTVKR